MSGALRTRHDVTRAEYQERWPTIKVGAALSLINGRAFKKSEWAKTGIPIVRIQNLNNPDAPFNYYQGILPAKIALDDGDLLFAWSGTPGTSFGAHIWRGGKAWLNQHIFKVDFSSEQFDKQFLQLAINQNLAEYVRAAHGAAGLAHITKDRFEASDLPIPSLPAQRRIVSEIEKQFTRVEAGVAALRRVKANLKRYRTAVLKAACEGRLVPTEADFAEDGGQTPGHAGGLLPRGWARVAMGEVGRWIGGGTPSKGNPRFWTGGDIPWVSPKDMKNDIITDAQDHITEAAVALSATNLVDRGSVLVVVRSGILRHTLPVAIAQRPVALNQDVKAVRPNGNVRSEYLALALKAFEREILHTCTKAGTTVQSVELPTFFRFQVPLPPLTEQVRIIGEAERQLSVVKELDVVVSANLQRATRLRQSILQRAFTGALVQ